MENVTEILRHDSKKFFAKDSETLKPITIRMVIDGDTQLDFESVDDLMKLNEAATYFWETTRGLVSAKISQLKTDISEKEATIKEFVDSCNRDIERLVGHNSDNVINLPEVDPDEDLSGFSKTIANEIYDETGKVPKVPSNVRRIMED